VKRNREWGEIAGGFGKKDPTVPKGIVSASGAEKLHKEKGKVNSHIKKKN